MDKLARYLLGPLLLFLLATPTHAQRRISSIEDGINYDRDFIHDLFPELADEQFPMTVQLATLYDHPAASPIEYVVSIGEGAKFKYEGCCLGGRAGVYEGSPLPPDPFLGYRRPFVPDLPFSWKGKVDANHRGAMFPHQRLRADFQFNSEGVLTYFQLLELADEIRKARQYMATSEDDFQKRLPIKQLERYFGKITTLHSEFYDQWSLSFARQFKPDEHSACIVHFEAASPNQNPRHYRAQFATDGTLQWLGIEREPEPPNPPATNSPSTTPSKSPSPAR